MPYKKTEKMQHFRLSSLHIFDIKMLLMPYEYMRRLYMTMEVTTKSYVRFFFLIVLVIMKPVINWYDSMINNIFHYNTVRVE